MARNTSILQMKFLSKKSVSLPRFTVATTLPAGIRNKSDLGRVRVAKQDSSVLQSVFCIKLNNSVTKTKDIQILLVIITLDFSTYDFTLPLQMDSQIKG